MPVVPTIAGMERTLKIDRRVARAAQLAALATGLAVVGAADRVDDLGTAGPLAGLALLAAACLAAGRSGRWAVLAEPALIVAGTIMLVGLHGTRAAEFAPLLVGLTACRELLSRAPLRWTLAAALLGLAPAVRAEGAESLALLGTAVAGCGVAARLHGAGLERRLQRAEWAATHEPLTGVWNRQAFEARLRSELRGASESTPVALLAIDLDGFRAVNELHGHSAGDAVLAETARRIDRAVSPVGFLARVGGDEFSVIVPGRAAVGVAERVVSAVAGRPVGEVWLGASVGVALADHPGVTDRELAQAADEALYEAKRAGKGRVVVAGAGALPTRDEAAERSAVHDLCRSGRISMVVQPIADLRTGDIRAYEALARIDSGDGPSGPLPWLDAAERVGLRDELEVAMLRVALDLYRRRPVGSRLNINLGPEALGRHDVRELIAAAGDLHGLTLEITENAIVEDYARLREQLAPLLDRGLRVAVDDVGAGQSNLQHVTALGPRYLKLDRALVQGLDADPAKAALVEAMARFAEQIGSYLVAEGVETAAECDVLVRLGVPYAQGYFLGRPADPWPAAAGLPAPVPAQAPAPAPDRTGVEGHPDLAVVGEAETAADVHALFADGRELAAAAIVDAEGTVLGLVTRHRMLALIGSRYGFPLFGDKPILRLADRAFVAVRPGTPRDEVVARAMARPAESRYDPILLVDGRFRLVGQLTIREILEHADAGLAPAAERPGQAPEGIPSLVDDLAPGPRGRRTVPLAS